MRARIPPTPPDRPRNRAGSIFEFGISRMVPGDPRAWTTFASKPDGGIPTMWLISNRPVRFTARAAATPLLLVGVALAIVLLGPAPQALAGTVVLNFETPPFPTAAQPNNFAAAGAMQTYTQAGVF